MIDESGRHIVQALAMKKDSADGYIVVLDAKDLSDWLRANHNLTEIELDLCREIADRVDIWALDALTNEIDANN